jgi:hypothetical protein
VKRLLCAVVVVGAFTYARAAAAQTPTSAQPSPADEQTLGFDRPEAWAMKYFTSVTLLSGLDTPEPTHSGSIDIGLEGGWLPRLTADQQRVGFNGTAMQDLNKAPVFLRPRVTIGLPRRMALIAAVVPPIRSFRITPRLASLGLEWTMVEANDWRMRWRAHGQVGDVTAAVTCPASVVTYAPGSSNNARGCNRESADVTTLRYAGLELETTRRTGSSLMPHAAVGVNIIDGVFQTDALTFGQLDRTRLRAAGVTFSASAGVSYAMGNRFALAADAFYSPLTVRRTATAPRSIDPLLNARVLLTYRVRR